MDKRITSYKDIRAVTLESSKLKVQVIPEMGSKMCSLIYKPKDIEMLIQNPAKKYKKPVYDQNYLHGECSGFDEMFPTISECYYESYPWKGVRIPDHGELWSLPWDYDISKDFLEMKVNGVRFPYKIYKKLFFTNANTIRMEYRLLNLSTFDFEFLWAAHTMFIIEEGARIVLPSGIKEVISTYSLSGKMGSFGNNFTWPEFKDDKGKKDRLDIIKGKTQRDLNKFYIKGKMPQGWCEVRYPLSSIILRLEFPNDMVPYLSILPNEGGWNDIYNIFIEPCTSSMDRIDVAKLRGELSVLSPRSTYMWYLDISVLEDTEIQK